MPHALYIRVLRQAATTLGDGHALAVFLNVAPAKLEGWLSGAEPVPQDVFLVCVDHLLDWEFAFARDQLFGETQDTRKSEDSGSPEA
jgi:hypothetical protein